MPIQQHPDYQEEKRRLTETKNYIQEVLKLSGENIGAFKAQIQQAMTELDPTDSSQSYINILTNTKFLEMVERDVHSLDRVREKPYFCRIDFKPADSPKIEKLYIGKTSLYRTEDHEPIIVDWRSPIANVYYEGRLGEVAYQTEVGTAKGELFLKRQYTIEQGVLEDYRDIDITTRDELLQDSLASNADKRLKEIVSTIQAEQNEVIRAEMHRPLIVQGVAGSGKTTIALHRIAYFIYTYADRFNPEQFMILAPNRLFIHYISDVLPELGVENVQQATWTDFASNLIGKKFKLSPDHKLVTFIEAENNEKQLSLLKWLSAFKGSMEFKDMIDGYIEDIKASFLPNKDLKIGKHIIYSREDMQRLFHHDYAYLPMYKRLDQMKKIFSSYLKTKKKDLQKMIEKYYDKEIDRCFEKMKDLEIRRLKVVSLMDTKEAKLQELEEKSKTLIKNYMAQFPKYELFDCYRQLLSKPDLIGKYTQQLDDEKINFLTQYSSALLDKKRYELEDMAALLYLKHHLFGLDDQLKIRNVVIDEAQDFSLFQLYALKVGLKTELFTILGDLSQGIHAYRGINDWETVMNEVFAPGQCQYMTLKQSYRTTIEIMELANQIIRQSCSQGLILAEPVVRHGEKPQLAYVQDYQSLAKRVARQIEDLKKDGIQSIAVIGKTVKECQLIDKHLRQECHLNIKLLLGEEDMSGADAIVIPSFIVKGLEFDAVFIAALDHPYTKEEMDIKLLYVAMTRPLHRLYLYGRKESIPLLDDVDNRYIDILEEELL